MFTSEILSLRSTCSKPTFVDLFYNRNKKSKKLLESNKKIHKLETYQCESWRGANIFEVLIVILIISCRWLFERDSMETTTDLDGEDDGSRRRRQWISTKMTTVRLDEDVDGKAR